MPTLMPLVVWFGSAGGEEANEEEGGGAHDREAEEIVDWRRMGGGESESGVRRGGMIYDSRF